jgi:hypothetical protein
LSISILNLKLVLIFCGFSWGIWGGEMGDSEVPQDVGLAVVAKAAMKEKELLQKERKKARLKKEMEAAQKKSL